MFKNIKLKNKLLISFLLVACISSILTTVFAIIYFSGEIENEARLNMHKNAEVAYQLYETNLGLVKQFTSELTGNGTFQIIVRFTPNKISSYLEQVLNTESEFQTVLVVDKNYTLLGMANRSNYVFDTQISTLKANPLLVKALYQKQQVAALEKISTPDGDVLALSAASPILRKRGGTDQQSEAVVGAAMVRYILNGENKLVHTINQLLKVSAALYHNSKTISFVGQTFETATPHITPTLYHRLMTQNEALSHASMHQGGELQEYRTLLDVAQQPIAVLGIALSADKFVNTTQQAVKTLLLIMLGCIVGAMILGYWLAQSILGPIYQLLTGVERVTSGDLSHEIIIDLRDELGILATSFNSMSRQLKDLFETLEQRIQDATRKLQNTLAHMTAIIDNMADGLLVTDIEGKVVRFNPAFAAMFPNQRENLGKHNHINFNQDIAKLVAKAENTVGEVYAAEILLHKQRYGKAVATAIVQKDTVSEAADGHYTGSKYIGSVILIRDITREKEIDSMLKNTIETLTRVGTALSAETNLKKLLELFVSEARSLTCADAGTLYILEGDHLNFEIVQNRSMDLYVGGSYAKSKDLKPIFLNEERYAAECVRSKKIIRTSTMSSSRDYAHAYKLFSDYKVNELLAVPMLDRQQNTVGVIQLFNPLDTKTRQSTQFTNNQIEIVNSLASQAAVAIENVRYYEQIERKNVALKRFVPTEFLSLLHREEIEDVKLGDASQEMMSVLFSDIRSFTTISETMTAEENFNFLNDYLSHIGPNITRNNGFIDKYIGDAIMALFAGSERYSAADDAVSAAVGMVAQLKEFNAYQVANARLPIDIGVGIHTGALTLGIIGFETRMESTVIGDTVNLASRMEGLTKQYRISISITEITKNLLSDADQFYIREVDTVQVKGKEEPVTVYEVFDNDPEARKTLKQALLPRYCSALNLYKQGQWQAALMLFNELHAALPEDKVFEVYQQRCQHFMTTPPAHQWQGVTRLDEK